jgi:predicted DNA-binding protein with PD1-like motif
VRLYPLLATLALLVSAQTPVSAQAQTQTEPPAATPIPEGFISPSRPVATGMAPKMKVKLVRQGEGERVFAIIFSPGDEVVSGLTDFAIKYHIIDAHFTGIGAVSSALTAYLVLDRGLYHALPVNEQVEVLSLIGDIATFNGKPIIHNHVVLGKQDGSTVGGHLFEAHVNPTLEVFLTANDTPLSKIPGPAGMKVIDPTQ